MDKWLSDSNEVLNISLVRSEKDTALLSGPDENLVDAFNPTFTYPIFGEHEKIFGYTDLDIQLRIASGSLKHYLSITYTDKLDSKETPADDIEGTLYKFIPPDYTKSEEAFATTVEGDSGFKPLGKKIGSYMRSTGKGKGKGKGKGSSYGETVYGDDENRDGDGDGDDDEVVFEMYHATWETPGFREYHRRMQLFILLFIEGGSYVHEDEDVWEFVVLYERRNGVYHFAGYTSVYPFWCFPDQIRLRLSQFVILPPYQHQGHGSRLYSALYQMCLDRKDVAELTVEDPGEAFEDLRDRCDLRFFNKRNIQADPHYPLGSDGRTEWLEQMRKQSKIAQRQFDRILEMLLYQSLGKSAKAVKEYRLHVKARLYRFNYEMLCQMTPEERKEALAKTYESVVEDYERIIEMAF